MPTDPPRTHASHSSAEGSATAWDREPDLKTRISGWLARGSEPRIGRRRGDSAEVIVAMSRSCERLAEPLARWLGASGWESLLARAVATAALEAPTQKLLVLGADGELHGVAGAGADETRDVCVEALTTIVHSLVRLIGRELAQVVMERALADDVTPRATRLTRATAERGATRNRRPPAAYQPRRSRRANEGAGHG